MLQTYKDKKIRLWAKCLIHSPVKAEPYIRLILYTMFLVIQIKFTFLWPGYYVWNWNITREMRVAVEVYFLTQDGGYMLRIMFTVRPH